MAKKLTDKEIERERHWPVRKANGLIRHARYSLSINQQRMLLYLISHIKGASKENGFPGDAPDTVYEFDIKKFCEVAGLKIDQGGYYYTELKAQLIAIDNFKAWLPTENGGEYRFQWFNKLELNKQTGIFKVSFHETARPFLFEIFENYTRIPLGDLISFKSKYSIRLYQLLKSFAWERKLVDKNQIIAITYTPEELRSLLDAEYKVIGFDIKKNEQIRKPIFKQFSQFRINVLKVAVDEINMYSEEIYVDYDLFKKGNKVTLIQFYIRSKKAYEKLAARENKKRRME